MLAEKRSTPVARPQLIQLRSTSNARSTRDHKRSSTTGGHWPRPPTYSRFSAGHQREDSSADQQRQWARSGGPRRFDAVNEAASESKLPREGPLCRVGSKRMDRTFSCRVPRISTVRHNTCGLSRRPVSRFRADELVEDWRRLRSNFPRLRAVLQPPWPSTSLIPALDVSACCGLALSTSGAALSANTAIMASYSLATATLRLPRLPGLSFRRPNTE